MYIAYGYVLHRYPYKCLKILNTYDIRNLEPERKHLLFEFHLSIRVSFELVGAVHMPRKRAATVLKPEVYHSNLCDQNLITL